MAYEKIVQDNQNLVKFWDQVFTELPEEETELTEDEDSFKELAPSEKLFEAACTLGHKKKVLDFGCGTAWASIIAAKSGCKDVTAVDAAPGAVKAAQTYSSRYGMESSIHLACGGLDFLQSVPFTVRKREYFAWPGEEKPTRRLFCLQKKEEQKKEV